MNGKRPQRGEQETYCVAGESGCAFAEAATVRHIFARYCELGSVRLLKEELGLA